MEEGRNAARTRSAYAGKLSGAASGLAPKSRSRFPISSSFLGGYIDTPRYVSTSTLTLGHLHVLHILVYKAQRHEADLDQNEGI